MGAQKLRLPRTAEEEWELAIAYWGEGHEAPVTALLRKGGELPAFAGSWLVGLIEGKVKRKRGPKVKNLTFQEAKSEVIARMRILEHYRWAEIQERIEKCLRKDRSGSPRDRAIERTAEELGESESRVRLIVRDNSPSRSGRKRRDG